MESEDFRRSFSFVILRARKWDVMESPSTGVESSKWIDGFFRT